MKPFFNCIRLNGQEQVANYYGFIILLEISIFENQIFLKMQVSELAQYTVNFINRTNRNVFLTGKAGTGKTTLLKEIIETTHKNTVVVAPTGIAALNAGGVTIHSLFQLPFAGFLPTHEQPPQIRENIRFENRSTLRRHFKMNKVKQEVIRNMELLIIDEVSMLRADVLDAMDFMLRSVRRNDEAFGGAQVLFIGDLLQLPPVVRQEDWEILKNYYPGIFFFHSHVIRQNPLLYIELDKIYRQTEQNFINVLNNLRNNRISKEDIQLLNKYVKPDFDIKKNEGYITLTTHNAKADNINHQALRDLKGESFKYNAEIVGDFPEKIYPIEEELELKPGAQIIFIKNDLSYEKRYFNGKMGIIHALSDEEITVHFSEEDKFIEVEKHEWENIRYSVDKNSKNITEEVLGTFTHYPIKLAWAITVHKSQGLTFDKAALDVSRVFVPGQAYVALSRLRSLDGLVLLNPIQLNGITNDASVMDYSKNKSEKETLKQELDIQAKKYIHHCIAKAFSWRTMQSVWKNHLQSYASEPPKSKKNEFKKWTGEQFGKIEELLVHSEKFIAQLNRLFQTDPYDFGFIEERFNKAYDYFFPKLDDLVFEVLCMSEKVKRTKKMKGFFEEISELEELQLKTVLNLKKTKLLVQAISEGKEFSKQTLKSNSLGEYRINHLVKISEIIKKQALNLEDDDDFDEVYYDKPKKQKTPKKPTIDITLELWNKKMTVEEIASERKLTTNTIYGHLAKLIEKRTVTLADVLPSDRIAGLYELFAQNPDKTSGELREISDNEFSWEELRLFRATLNLEKEQ